MSKCVVLIIRDGWGEAKSGDPLNFNAIHLAKTPCADRLVRECPHAFLKTSGLDVGLPEGVMGNSEVGHQNIGAGRIVDQDRVRIDKACSSGAIQKNLVLQAACNHVLNNQNSTLHFMGLISNAGVHSILEHLFALWKAAMDIGVQSIVLHGITDGRDSPAFSAPAYLKEIEAFQKTHSVGKIGSVVGRFWAMDRDQRWDRVQKAYECLVNENYALQVNTPREAIQNYYDKPLSENQLGDEFILPTQVMNDGESLRIKNGDSVLFFNFRGDRPRQLLHAFLDEDFKFFNRKKIKNLFCATLTNYEEGLTPYVLFDKPEKMKNILGEVIANEGLRQFRSAETEKYPHVTFFFNDYREEPFVGEDRALVPSPRHVATYDQSPEMSAELVTQKTVEAILSEQYSLVVVNYANPDMVGHTGSLQATIKACEVVDQEVDEILKAVDRVGAIALVTADHGNAEEMWDLANNCPHTRHTLNKVPVVLYGKALSDKKLREDGCLADIAPTLLDILGIQQPQEMTGTSLIIKN